MILHAVSQTGRSTAGSAPLRPLAADDASTFPSMFDADEETDFAELGLPAALVASLTRDGIATPFPIQTVAIPDALAGRDILGRAQTGSGKTLAFGLPMLARLAGGRSGARRPRGLVLVPTRELAMQVADALAPLARAVRLSTAVVVGGTGYERQVRALAQGVDVLVATPGRLKDLIERRACALDAVEVSVLDEADQMADMGFLPDVTELLAHTPAGGQRMLFSATLDADVRALVDRFLADPVTHHVSAEAAPVETMEHHLLCVPEGEKFAVVASIAARHGRTILFVRTQVAVDELVGRLAAVGVRAGALHGGKTQRVRTRTLAEFREGTVDVLVATDVAARGIHVDGVSLVVHVDPPKLAKDYLHRSGRTARAGEAGTVVTLVLPRQQRTTEAMVARAGVALRSRRVKPGDPALAALAGAREPSGVPVVTTVARPGRAGRRRHDRPGTGRYNRRRP